jgi:hypothetical protein
VAARIYLPEVRPWTLAGAAIGNNDFAASASWDSRAPDGSCMLCRCVRARPARAALGRLVPRVCAMTSAAAARLISSML